jgi:hypothetical protein
MKESLRRLSNEFTWNMKIFPGVFSMDEALSLMLPDPS